MKVVVTGATGFLGRPLCTELVGEGHEVTTLSRNPERSKSLLGSRMTHVAWGRESGGAWKEAVVAADAVIHLAGESVAGQRWTPEYKARIRSSRVETTRAIVEVILSAKGGPRALVNASAVGYYGDCGDEILMEEHAPGNDFLADVCREWEAEALRARGAGVRVAVMRIGIVLGPGGLLEQLLHPMSLPINPWKFGLGGPLGSGRQWMAWIHREDVVGLFRWSATEAEISGPCNVTAPNPVTNRDFSRAIGRIYGRPAGVAVPPFALRAMIGEFADSALGSQRALPTVALKQGYRFRFTDVDTALRATLQKGPDTKV